MPKENIVVNRHYGEEEFEQLIKKLIKERISKKSIYEESERLCYNNNDTTTNCQLEVIGK